MSVYGIRLSALQEHYSQDNDKARYKNELRNLDQDITRSLKRASQAGENNNELHELLECVEDKIYDID